MTRNLFRRRARREDGRHEDGNALVLALVFLSVCGLTIGGLLTFANTSSDSTIALRTARNQEYDADSAMAVSIASVRALIGTACTTGGATVYTGTTSSYNGTALYVTCYALTSASGQRNDLLSVCLNGVTVPCPDAKALLRSNVIFYDTPSTGASLGIQTWSNQ